MEDNCVAFDATQLETTSTTPILSLLLLRESLCPPLLMPVAVAVHFKSRILVLHTCGSASKRDTQRQRKDHLAYYSNRRSKACGVVSWLLLQATFVNDGALDWSFVQCLRRSVLFCGGVCFAQAALFEDAPYARYHLSGLFVSSIARYSCAHLFFFNAVLLCFFLFFPLPVECRAYEDIKSYRHRHIGSRCVIECG